MDKILVPTLRFPPAGGVGLRRMIKIAKYLARLGVAVHFITTDNHQQINNYNEDVQSPNIFVRKLPSLSLSNLLNTTPRSILGRILRTLLYYLTCPIFFVDYATLWGLVLVPYSIYYARKHNIRYIYVSGAPFSTLWHGALIKKWLGKRICFIAEWRDVWIEDQARLFLWPRPLFRFIQAKMEHQVLRAADIVITVTQDIGQALREKSGNPAKVVVLENGFDEEELNAATSGEGEACRDADVIRMVYTGNIFGTRTEGFLLALKAVAELAAAGVPIVFEIMGAVSYRTETEVRVQYSGLISRGQLVFHGIDTPAAAISLLKQADYGLVIMQREHPEGLTSKLFEYCAAGKTVVGIGPDGELKRKMETGGLGIYIELDDEGAVAKLADYIKERKRVPAENFEVIRKNSCFRNIAAEFKQLAENI